MATRILIDGSMGEGGGQVLRSALALSMALGKAFCISEIRGKRPKPGLKRQHLTCVRGAQALCNARVEGDAINSMSLDFTPAAVQTGDYQFQIGTGGSITMVLQALVPPLLFADKPSSLLVSGGTHVPHAPPFEFLRDTLFPHLELLGPKLTAQMNKIGYMEIGGGSVRVDIIPTSRPGSLQLYEAGAFAGAEASIYGHNLPEGIIERELGALLDSQYKALGLGSENIACKTDPQAPDSPTGAGNTVLVTVRRGKLATVCGECGWRGRTAEKVAHQAARRALSLIKSGIPVEAHLADQLLVPLALAGGGSFVTERLSSHSQTCLAVIAQFMELESKIESSPTRGVRLSLKTQPKRAGVKI